MAEPAISVILPGWNVARYLPATLESIARQTFADYEVLMVDDGSTDDTAQVMERWSRTDTRFKTLRLPVNSGVVAARNAALSVAQGDFVAMIDGDDLWTPDALAVRLDIANAYPAAILIATDFSWFQSEPDTPYGGRLARGFRARAALSPALETGDPMLLPDPFEVVATVHFVWTGATLIRRQAITEAGNFDTRFTGPEDTWLWLRLANRGPFVFLPRITAHYRQRPGSLVHSLREPKEFHYITVLNYALKDPQLRARKNVLLRLKSECHAVSALHFRRNTKWRAALSHAFNGILAQPARSDNWRHAIAALMRR